MTHTRRFRTGGCGHFETLLSVDALRIVNSPHCSLLLNLSTFGQSVFTPRLYLGILGCIFGLFYGCIFVFWVWILLNCMGMALTTVLYDFGVWHALWRCVRLSSSQQISVHCVFLYMFQFYRVSIGVCIFVMHSFILKIAVHPFDLLRLYLGCKQGEWSLCDRILTKTRILSSLLTNDSDYHYRRWLSC